MKKESKHSQDHAHKQNNDRPVSDTTSLRGGFIDGKSKPADKKDWAAHVQKPDK
jgi:hypothetical protein